MPIGPLGGPIGISRANAPGASPVWLGEGHQGLHRQGMLELSAMQASGLNHFANCLSRDRISVYYRRGDTDCDAISKYLWNIQLCESMYPCLNMLEVALRNAIHHAFTMRHGSKWFEVSAIPFNNYQQNRLFDAKSELQHRNLPLSPGRIIAELDFGFWVSMFGKNIDRSWRGLLQHAFPSLPSVDRTVPKLRMQLDPLRRFRNRVFHHERILHCSPGEHHTNCQKVIGWINPDMMSAVDAIDRFADIYSQGMSRCRAIVDGWLASTSDSD